VSDAHHAASAAQRAFPLTVEEKSMTSSSKYLVKGTYFEGCNCTTVCPCIFLSDPTHGFCEVIVGWHVEEGRLGKIDLAGLNVAAWVRTAENMIKGNWHMAVYLDERASADQRQALLEIWSGQHGGHPQVLASLTSEILGVRSVPIEFSVDGKHKSLKISNVAELDISAIDGGNGKEVTIHNMPLAVAPTHPSVVHKSNRVQFSDFGQKQNVSGTSGFSSPFMYSA
jgi:hypothetical protein